jgi:sulfotransferase family protein
MAARLPNFLIAGAARSGTTWLAGHLARHPQVFMAQPKELYFFEREELWAQGADWYASRFAAAGDAVAVGEATPSYMFYPWAVERIEELLPDVRLIVSLRDPVERAYSHYLYWRDSFPFETRSFARAIEDELAAGADEIALHRTDTDPPYFAYVARGLYLPQLERLEAAFGRERLHVVTLDDLRADPQGALRGTCGFLGVDDTLEIEDSASSRNAYRAHRPLLVWHWMNRRRVVERSSARRRNLIATLMPLRTRPVPAMDPAVRSRLAAHFAPHNAALGTWLGRDLSAWGSG